MLPNGYIPVDLLSGANCYFDTGIVPSNTLSIYGLFYSLSTNAYLFGARNSNSNTAAGQLNALVNSGGTSYIGYCNARLTLNENPVDREIYIQSKGNYFNVLTSTSVFEKTGATNTFTGTRTMYILAMNNGGSVNYGTGGTASVEAFRIENNGSEIANYVPCFDEANSEFGLYDTVSNTFLHNLGTGTFNSLYLLEVVSDDGGTAYIQTKNAGNVKKQYKSTPQRDIVTETPCIAIPKKGYEFVSWTDSDGNIVSTEDSYTPTLTQDTVLKANFIKKTDYVQHNPYQVLALEYGVGEISSSYSPNGNLSNLYSTVRNFTCKEDALSRATTTIELESVPSTYQNDMPIFLINPKGKILWCGIIKSIEGNNLTCREAVSIYDSEEICVPSNSVNGDNISNRNLFYGTWVYYLYHFIWGNNNLTTNPNPAIVRMLEPISSGYSGSLYFGNGENILASFPLTTETEIVNVEDKIFDIFNQFGVVAKPQIFKQSLDSLPEKGYKNLLRIEIINPRKYGKITIANNLETISNVEINIENQENTVLTVFNSTGATLRGIYGMKTDGTISEIETIPTSAFIPSDFVGYKECKNKIVMSDDKIISLVEQYLNNALYNHKITFDVDLTEEHYRLEDFELGRSVDFYDGNKLYKSIVTAKEFSYEGDDIKTVKVTLGNVRTTLTAKLNLGKAGKKK